MTVVQKRKEDRKGRKERGRNCERQPDKIEGTQFGHREAYPIYPVTVVILHEVTFFLCLGGHEVWSPVLGGT